jgi:iron complex outermembrane recepter protein
VTRIFRKPPGFEALRRGIASACVFLASYAFGSDAPGPDAHTVETDRTLSEIVVTAERRAESIAKVAIVITAFSQKTMGELHIENLSDLASIAPDLTVQISA